jgi:hypothetical protein
MPQKYLTFSSEHPLVFGGECRVKNIAVDVKRFNIFGSADSVFDDKRGH